MNRAVNVETYAAALRALVHHEACEPMQTYGSSPARDVLRKAAPCGACVGTGRTVVYPGSSARQPCYECHGAGWSQASLDEHLRAAAGNEVIDSEERAGYGPTRG